jgi:ABC-type branched-subunit amino acid transport system substrate-binding protein
VLSGELKIGVIAPLSGSSSAFGNAIRNGITLAVDERNAIVLVRDGQRSFFTRVTP